VIKPISVSGQQLYALLPEVYRNRDNGDLADYLNGFGEVLDRVRATLDQRLADSFPDNNPDGLSCQSWLIPYFAKLVDAHLYAPDVAGQREEVANAVAWRKRKGTLSCIEEISEFVGRMEIELQEGWKRVAITPCVAMPRITAKSIDNTLNINFQHLSQAAMHPALPAAMVDIRKASFAVAGNSENPASKQSKFGGKAFWWRQQNRHGAPAHPGSFDDVSRRTVDVRKGSWKQGQIDARKVLLFAPPPAGFYDENPIRVNWAQIKTSDAIEVSSGSGMTVYRNVSKKQVQITGAVSLNPDTLYCFEDLLLNNKIMVPATSHLQLRRCSARNIVLENTDTNTPVLDARDCLFKQLSVQGQCLMEYCTVLGEATLNGNVLLASDCIFAGDIVDADARSCLRYSRIPADMVANTEQCTQLPAAFYSYIYRYPSVERSCGVLHPVCADDIRFGAEDGGEMGAFHHRHYCLRELAIIDKLKEFLPLGIEAVLIPDQRLTQIPRNE